MAGDENSGPAQRPLAGVVMCCTSILPEKRSDLAAIASQMGAIHNLDLTSDVTHLIVGDTDTPKYKYVARERPDVKCLLPEWVEAVRESWLEGGETDVEALEVRYRLPTFAGLRVCVTGFDNLFLRKELEETIKRNGGEYKGDLTKDVSHLIAHKPAGDKYNFAKSWGLRIVTIEWLQQSVERGMILEESLYDPLLAPAQRGLNAWIRRTVSTSSLKRAREEDIVLQPPRKLRRTASARFSDQNDSIWTDIVGSDRAAEAKKKGEWEDLSKTVNITKDMRPLIKEVSRIVPNTRSSTPIIAQESFRTDYGLFHGKKFLLHGFDTRKTAVLERHLRSQDAEIITELSQLSGETTQGEEDPSFILVPHSSSECEIPSTPETIPQPTVVTDMWIERCLHQKRYVQPNAYITNSPFLFPVPGFEELVVCCTAFEGIALLQASKVIKLMGATYDEYLTENTSVLVCNESSLSREKIRHALDWGVPTVNAEWLWDCLKSNRRRAYDAYLIHPEKQSQRESNTRKKSLQHSDQTERVCHSDSDTKSARNIEAKNPSKKYGRSAGGNNSPSVRQSVVLESFQEVPRTDSISGRIVQDAYHTPTESIYLDEGTSPEYAPPGETASSLPLQEIPTNSPPKPLPPRKHSLGPSNALSEQADKELLNNAITSLLAHHKRSPRKPILPSTEGNAGIGRRKRRLFGRALSNISTGSIGSINVSRASSVDTVNTDGMGTPLELTHSVSGKSENHDVLTASLLAGYDEADEGKKAEEAPPMTQLGYEDPEAGAWREKLMSKMSGKAEKMKPITPKSKGIGTVQDAAGLQSVSRRTRYAGTR